MASVDGTAQIQDLSVPSRSPNVNVGDRFLVTISGAPNQSVSMSSTQNSKSYGQWVLGSTNAAGNFTMTGVEGYGNAGSWTETWYVGGVAASPTLVFTVGSALSTLYCSGMTPPYINTFDIPNGPQSFAVTAAGTACLA